MSYENAFFDVLVVGNSLTDCGDRYVVYGQKPKVEGLEETMESNSSSSPRRPVAGNSPTLNTRWEASVRARFVVPIIQKLKHMLFTPL